MSDQTDKPAQLKKGEKLVNIACRATKNCGGKSAVMKIIKQNATALAGGGRMASYTCTECGKPFMIST